MYQGSLVEQMITPPAWAPTFDVIYQHMVKAVFDNIDSFKKIHSSTIGGHRGQQRKRPASRIRTLPARTSLYYKERGCRTVGH